MRLSAALAALVLVAVAFPAGVAGGATATTHDQCSFPVTATDATGTDMTVSAEPQRVVVLQASAAQVMWEIGAREKVVGMPVKPYTAYLDGSRAKTDVLTAEGQVERETVVGLQPDLVLAPNVVRNETVEQLRRDGLTVYRTDFGRSFEDIYAKTRLFGRLVGRCGSAERTVTSTQSRVRTIRQAVAGEDRPRVLYEFYNFTAGKGTFIDEVIRTAGGDNVAANAGVSGYAKISDEVVAERDPQWLVHPSDAPLPGGEPYASTTAYRRNQTVEVNANYMNQPGPRIVGPLSKLAATFHPEAYAAANATATETRAATPETTQPRTPGSETSQPGFGLSTAVAALALLGALVGRRLG